MGLNEMFTEMLANHEWQHGGAAPGALVDMGPAMALSADQPHQAVLRVGDDQVS
jgi:hypothetical protein